MINLLPAGEESRREEIITKRLHRELVGPSVVGPSVEVVPRGRARGRARQELYDKGCVADLLELKGDWNQQQIFEALECTFAS